LRVCSDFCWPSAARSIWADPHCWAGRWQTIERNIIEPLQDPALFGAAADEVRTPEARLRDHPRRTVI